MPYQNHTLSYCTTNPHHHSHRWRQLSNAHNDPTPIHANPPHSAQRPTATATHLAAPKLLPSTPLLLHPSTEHSHRDCSAVATYSANYSSARPTLSFDQLRPAYTTLRLPQHWLNRIVRSSARPLVRTGRSQLARRTERGELAWSKSLRAQERSKEKRSIEEG